MANILDVLSPREVITYVESRVNTPRIGDALFPNRKIDALEFEYVTGANGLPVSASMHSWDSETQVGTRLLGGTARQELALIKRKLPIREKEIIAFANPRNNAELNSLIEGRLNDVDILVNGVLARTEAMKMEVVAKGVIDVNENGIVGSIDYGVPADQKLVLSGADLFTSPDADVIGILTDAVDAMRSKGQLVTRAIASTPVIRLMAGNTAIKNAINGNGNMMVSLAQLNNFFSQFGLPTFVAYDEMYNFQNADGSYTVRRYFPEDYIALLPEGPLGEGLFGPTAEEVDLMNDAGSDVTMVGMVLAMIYKTSDPVMHWTKAVASFMPSFTAVNGVMSIKVK